MNNFFGKYQVLSLLGEGGMGKVYRAFDTQLKRIVALKILTSKDLELVQRFIIETRAVAKLNHPNIIKVYQTGIENGVHFFTMECIEGKQLDDFLHDSVDLRTKILILSRICSAIHYCHENNIIHRDLKLSNIMIRSNSNSPIVMDFGLAKNQEDSFQLTKTGQLLGTPVFMSPEQASSKTIDQRSDVYSLGIIMYKMLTEKMPYNAESLSSLLNQIIRKPIIPAHKVDPNIPIALSQICQKATRKKARGRYATALLLSKDLKDFLRNKKQYFLPLYLNKRILFVVAICFFLFFIRMAYISFDKSVVVSKITSNFNDPIQQAKFLYQQEFFEESFRLFESLLPTANVLDRIMIYEYLVYLSLEIKEYEEAIKYYGLIIKSKPATERLSLAVGKAHYYQKNFAAAENFLGKILKSKKLYLQSQFYKGLICFERQNYSEAISLFKKAYIPKILEDKQLKMNIEYYFGVCYFQIEEMEQAISYFLKTLPFTQQKNTYLYLAKCYIFQKKWQKAFTLLEKNKNIRKSEYFYLLGLCLEKQHKIAQAHSFYIQALNADILNLDAVQGVMRTNLHVLSLRDGNLIYLFRYFNALTERSSHVSDIYMSSFIKIKKKYEKYYFDWLYLIQKDQPTKKLLQKIATARSQDVYNIATKGIVGLRYQENIEEDISKAIKHFSKKESLTKLNKLLDSIRLKKREEKKYLAFYYLAKSIIDKVTLDDPLHQLIDDNLLIEIATDVSLNDITRYLSARMLCLRLRYTLLESFIDGEDKVLGMISRLVLRQENVRRYKLFLVDETTSDFLASLVAKYSESPRKIELLNHKSSSVKIHSALNVIKGKFSNSVRKKAIDIIKQSLFSKEVNLRGYTNFLFWKTKFAIQSPQYVPLFVKAATDPNISVRVAALKNYNKLHQNDLFMDHLKRNRFFIKEMEKTLQTDNLFTLRVLAGIWLQTCNPRHPVIQKIRNDPNEIFFIRFIFSIGATSSKISFQSAISAITNFAELLDSGDTVLRGAAYLTTSALGSSLEKYIEKEKDNSLKARLLISYRIKRILNFGTRRDESKLLKKAQKYIMNPSDKLRLASAATIIALSNLEARTAFFKKLLKSKDVSKKKGAAIGYYSLIEKDLPRELFSKKFYSSEEEEYETYLEKMLTTAKPQKQKLYLKWLQNAISLDKNDLLFYEQALLYEKGKSYKNAIKSIDMAINLQPKNRYFVAKMRILGKISPQKVIDEIANINYEKCTKQQLSKIIDIFIQIKRAEYAYIHLKKYSLYTIEKSEKKHIHLWLYKIFQMKNKTRLAEKHRRLFQDNSW